MHRLTQIGFRNVGKWIISEKNSTKIEYKLYDCKNESDIIYAFECNEIVYYIGITQMTLKNRMDNYKAGKQDGQSGSTNKKVNRKIIDLLETNSEVKIHVLIESETKSFNSDFMGYKISLAKGIEDSLIKSFDANILWNERSINKTSEMKITNKKNIATIKIGDTYFKEGKLIFPQKQIDYSLLPSEQCYVKIYKGWTGDYFTAKLIFSTNGQARINSIEIKKWFESERLKVGQTFLVEIISQKEYRILNN